MQANASIVAELRREKQEALSAIQSKDKDLGQAQRDLSQAQVGVPGMRSPKHLSLWWDIFPSGGTEVVFHYSVLIMGPWPFALFRSVTHPLLSCSGFPLSIGHPPRSSLMLRFSSVNISSLHPVATPGLKQRSQRQKLRSRKSR